MNDCQIDSIQSTISCCIRSCIFDLHTGLVAHTYVKLTIVLFNKTCVQKTVAGFLNECALCFLLTLSLCFVMFCSHKPRYDKYSFNNRLPSLSNGILCFNFDNSIRRILIVCCIFVQNQRYSEFYWKLNNNLTGSNNNLHGHSLSSFVWEVGMYCK